MKEWQRVILFLVVFSLSLVGLKYWRQHSPQASAAQIRNQKDSLANLQDTLENADWAIRGDDTTALLLSLSNTILTRLEENGFEGLANYIDSSQSLWVSPYAYLSDDTKKLKPSQLPSLNVTTKQYWGLFDGSGDSIMLDPSKYLNRFVLDRPFKDSSEITVNHLGGRGNSIDNHHKFFPQSHNVTYFVNGSERYGEMDWKQLKLVYEASDGRMYLRALIHDEWTI